MNAVQVTEAIETAFADVRRDPEQSLHQAQLTDQGIAREIADAEWEASALLDGESSWHEVPEADLLDCTAALSHFTPQSWSYYLPAYMRAALKYLGIPMCKCDLPHWVLHSLTYSDNYPGMGWYKLERFETLTRAQAEAVEHFLRFASESGGYYSEAATDSLKKYWGLPRERRPNKSLQPTAASGG